MGTWLNDDGLYIKFDTAEGEVTTGGEATTDGEDRVIKLNITAEDLLAHDSTAGIGGGATKILADNVIIPDGAFVKSATFEVTEAFAGATATLTIGLYDTDRSTVYDADGIDATIAVTAIDAVGDTIACDGDVVGAIISNGGTNVLITAVAGTATFTDGTGQLTIVYRMLS